MCPDHRGPPNLKNLKQQRCFSLVPHPHCGSAGSSALHNHQPRTRVRGALTTSSWQKKVYRLLMLSPRCGTCNVCSHIFWPKQVTRPSLSSPDGEMPSCHVPAKKTNTNTANTLVMTGTAAGVCFGLTSYVCARNCPKHVPAVFS